ncbi:MAG TPA: hypothetical protein VKB27_02650 [Gammaproteobacteria bacterium]|nr:hypothetical protein [Gammaproteobacteria bacterium]
MLDWLSKKKKDERIKEIREQALKKSLSEKVAQYQKVQEEPAEDHTEIFVNGKKLRVAKEQITLGGD